MMSNGDWDFFRSKRGFVAGLAVLSVIAQPGVANAQATSVSLAPPRGAVRSQPLRGPTTGVASATGHRWYGWQPAIADVVAFSMMSAGLFGNGLNSHLRLALAVGGGGVFFAAAPIMHWVRGSVGRGFASMLGFRLGFAALGQIAGLIAWSRTSDTSLF